MLNRYLGNHSPASLLAAVSLTVIVTVAQCAAASDDSVVVLFDELDQKTSGDQSGGMFVEGGGYTLTGNDQRIVWKIPSMGPNGMLEVDIRNLDPPNQVTAQKNLFLSMWGKDIYNNHEDEGLDNTDGFELRMGTAEYNGVVAKQFRIEYHAKGYATALLWEPVEDGVFDVQHTYHVRLVWIEGETWLTLDNGGELHFEGFSQDPLDHFEWLVLGTTTHFGAEHTKGPIYSNIRITALNNVDPAAHVLRHDPGRIAISSFPVLPVCSRALLLTWRHDRSAAESDLFSLNGQRGYPTRIASGLFVGRQRD